jgi:acetyl esterase/lipase
MSMRLGICSVCVMIVMLLGVPVSMAGSEPTVEPLWPDGAPGAKGNAEGDKPTLTIYLPSKEAATGTAIVICPGGGYGHLAMDHEGHQIAQWLNSLGVAGFIVKYRHRNSGAGYGHPAPLQDAQRAIRTVRAKAAQWGIDPHKIGILGFSAGGHLVSCRPDFMILMYPVISLVESFVHSGSGRNLLGSNPDKSLVESLSNERQVTPQTPPTFLIHTYEDNVVPAENSIYFYLALRKAGVPAEMHVYQKGPHGFGLGRTHGAVSTWPALCAHWLRGQGLLDSRKKPGKQR